ncbi:glycosyltransferase family 4 protein [Candidatus Accumulibacter sp. ACC003]|uniref:glycosyltransferase family 4 protein n=1 Tax=Candidatus Accumulibacter sp. ACC003 TaxID=2823334 RepID=UPI0025BA2839|nr:glycosyltransferase family 4 protein [Candidatus Accumulibacter sp. ACC003]
MIVFVHLLNDRSGSPRVLSSVVTALGRGGDRLRLFVGSDGSGCLDEAGIETTRYWYRRMPYRLLTLITYMGSQLSLLTLLFRSRDIDRKALIYVNTLLPFGAALYGWMTRRPVIYHLHEVSVSPAPLRWFLTAMARLAACRLIYVSDFHRGCLPIPGVRAITVYNALDEPFLTRARVSRYEARRGGLFNVLMLASLRDYKGVPELLKLAKRLVKRKDIQFDLVVNDDAVAVQRYFAARALPANLTIHPRTDDPATYYARACLVMNLSRPDQWVETFGLTLLEAMAFGIPVIAPPVGGPLELVTEGREGFLIDCRCGEELAEKVRLLADDQPLCVRLSTAARAKASQFSPQAFGQALREAVNLQASEESWP